MREAAPDSPNCHNCGALLAGPFCAACGQRALPLDQTTGEFLRELRDEFLQVDGKVLASVQRLFLSPGFLTAEQFAGRRARWVSPLRLYLLFSVLYFGIVSLASGHFGDQLRIRVTGATSEKETAAELHKIGFNSEDELRDAVTHARLTWVPRAMFVLVPFLAWLVGIAARSAGKTYLQHVYFSLHLQAAWFGAAAVAALPGVIAPKIASGLTMTLPVFALLYTVPALHRAYGGTKAQAWRRGIVVVGVYGVATVLVTLAIVLPVVLWRIWTSQ